MRFLTRLARRPFSRPVWVVLLGLAAVGCGPDLPPNERYMLHGLSRQEDFDFLLPEARHVTPDVEGPFPRLVVSLLRSGDMRFKGNVWPLPADDAEASAAAVEALHFELARLLVNPDLRDAEGRSLVPLMLNADGRAPWRALRQVIPVTQAEDVGAREIQWAVRSPILAPRASDCRVSALVVPDERAAGAGTVVSAWLQPDVLVIGDDGWDLPPPAEGGPPKRVLEPTIWDHVGEVLSRRAGPPGRARVRVDDDVPWAHVAALLDTLLGTGFREVTLRDLDLRLEIQRGPPCGSVAPDEPAATPGLLLACAIAVVLAFLVTFRPWHRHRR